MAYMAKAPHSVFVVDGAKIRHMRDRAGWSLSAFAKELDTDISHLSRIERGKGQPSARLRNRIAEVLAVSLDEIAQLRDPKTAAA